MRERESLPVMSVLSVCERERESLPVMSEIQWTSFIFNKAGNKC